MKNVINTFSWDVKLNKVITNNNLYVGLNIQSKAFKN